MNTKELAIERAGSASELARRIGVQRQAIQQWGDRVPAGRAWAVHKATGIPLEVLLAPDDANSGEQGNSPVRTEAK